MDDSKFWDLVDDYENGKITSQEVLEEVCRSTKSYTVATADFVLVVKRSMTKEEKEFVKEKMYGKNNKRSS